MRNIFPVVIGCVALLVNFFAFGFFVAWLSETDFMFGHFKGKPEYILSALALSLFGAIATTGWMFSALLAFRNRDKSTRTRGAALKIVGGLCVLFMGATSIVIVPIGAMEWSDARATMRRNEASRAKWGEREMPPSPEEISEETNRLVRALDDEDYYVRSAAANSLSRSRRVDSSAIPKLIEAALRREELTSMYVVRALENFGEDASAAIPALIALLDADIVLRLAAGEALAAIGRPAMMPVVEASRSTDPVVRAASTVALSKIIDADSAMRMNDLLVDPDPMVRKSAIDNIQSVPPFTRDLIEQALEDSDPDVRAAAKRKLIGLAKSSRDQIVAARLELSSPYTNNRVNAALSLAGQGADARSVLPELYIALKDPELRARMHAAEAIWMITGDPSEAMPTLIEVLESGPEHDSLRCKLYRFLRERGPAAKGALPALRVLEQSPDQGTRLQAKTAIRLIDVEQ